MYTIPVKDAIEAGKKNLVSIPAIPLKIFIIASFSLPILVFKGRDWGLGNIFHEYFWVLFIVSILALLWSILWRSLHSAAWKIWALENVTDAHRLYEVAERKGMIYKRNSWLNKLEFKTREQAEQLEALELRLLQPRQMEYSGLSKPLEEIQFKYELKREAIAALPFMVLAIAVSYFTGNLLFLFFPFGLVGIFILGSAFYRISKPPSLTLTPQALQIKQAPPIPWKDIEALRVERRQHGKSTLNYLVADLMPPQGSVELDISGLGNSVSEVEETLYEYWAWGKKQA